MGVELIAVLLAERTERGGHLIVVHVLGATHSNA